MAEPLIFTGTYGIKEGKLDEAKKALDSLVDHVKANEPRLLHFGFYINDAGTGVTCVQVHPDSESMSTHMQVIQDHLQECAQYLDFSDMDTRAYGTPSNALLTELRDMDGDALHVSGLGTGFTRLPSD
jgi:hypothetical protein